jgi:hypothetical protein
VGREAVNRRAALAVVVFSVVIGTWGCLYGLSRGLNPRPLGPQVYPDGTSSQPPAPEPPAGPLRYDRLVQRVAPLTGTTIPVHWGDMGQKLIEAGAIDLTKFEARHGNLNDEQRAALLGDDVHEITFMPENIQFWTNVLWSLGLTQTSKVLDEGPMRQNEAQTPLDYYASTGGWTLGSKPATELYSSVRLMELTPEQDDLVYRVAEQVYRPCCGNSTAYPDCNHGMAVLGLLELLASQGASEDELYQAALTFNAYAFSDTYVALAAYFALQDVPWSDVSAQTVLGPDYSSGQGVRRITAAVGPIPSAPGQGEGCGA